jgi:hypothetical protein
LWNLHIDAHRGERRERGDETATPPGNLKILVNKNAIKPKIRDPCNFVLNALTPTPLRDIEVNS